MADQAPPTHECKLDLTKDEHTILNYIISISSSDYGDPLKDTYELGDDEPEDKYEVLKSLAKKVHAMKWGDQ